MGADYGAFPDVSTREEGRRAMRIDMIGAVLTIVFSDDDQSFELRLAGLYKAGSWLVVGLDSRGRYNLSSDLKRTGHSSIEWEAQAGASAAFGLGPLLLSTLVGPSFLQRSYLEIDGSPGETQLRSGRLAMAGAGATF
jgi:hypothetical protein